MNFNFKVFLFFIVFIYIILIVKSYPVFYNNKIENNKIENNNFIGNCNNISSGEEVSSTVFESTIWCLFLKENELNLGLLNIELTSGWSTTIQQPNIVDLIIRSSNNDLISANQANSSTTICHPYTDTRVFFITATGLPQAYFTFTITVISNSIQFDSTIDFTTQSNQILYFSLNIISQPKDKKNAPLELTVYSEDPQVSIFMAAWNSCVPLIGQINDPTLTRNLTYLTFSNKARLVLPYAMPNNQSGTWFFGVNTVNISSSKIFNLTATYGLPPSDYVGSILLLLIGFSGIVILCFILVGVLVRIIQTKIPIQGKYLSKELRRSEYFWFSILCSLFFIIPAVQVAGNIAFSEIGRGDRDACYYNEFCLKPEGYLLPFNNIYSNLGYIVCGLALLIYVKILQESKWEVAVPRDYSLIFAISWAILSEGILSAIYHICPTRAIFQFDSAFMFVIATMGIIEMYRKFFNTAPRGSRTFLFIASIIFLNYLGSILDAADVNQSGQNEEIKKRQKLFRLLVYLILFIPFFIIVMIRKFYYHEQKSWFGKSNSVINQLKDRENCLCSKPGRFLVLLITFILITLCTFVAPDISQMFLGSLSCTLMVAIVAYTIDKFMRAIKKARDPTKPPTNKYYFLLYAIWFLLTAGFLILGLFAMKYFVSPSSDKSDQPWESRNTNTECIILDFYDTHDLWHVLSAMALSLMTLLLCHFDRDERKKIVNINELNSTATTDLLLTNNGDFDTEINNSK
eukprot:TRINITY_DN1202_c0_g5_i1.p1 TRINITY_DN1202_c0_g5~~TRINITY_DN1202_c0_g5_i1.p1  ORF type:complete len:744 (+),score=299.15 TRINITY_DN1202_c0_g5_i1:22-2253(+)